MQFIVGASGLSKTVLEAKYLQTIAPDGELQWQGDCETPPLVYLRGVHDQIIAFYRDLDPATPAVVGWAFVRCRKCPKCKMYRRRVWTMRALCEVALSGRTWFGTFTIAPEHRVKFLYRAHLEVSRRRAEAWHKVPRTEQFRYLGKAIGDELTKYLKRIRKNSGASLRYLLVSEAHKDGFPHFHVLIHEVSGNVTERALRGSWSLGWSMFKLVPVGEHALGVRYVCKYLSKSALTRIRASQRYGQSDDFIAKNAERLLEVSRVISETVNAGKGPSPKQYLNIERHNIKH